jgi:hypothetical protein
MSGRRSIRSDGCVHFENPTPSPHPFHTGTRHACTLSTAASIPSPTGPAPPSGLCAAGLKHVAGLHAANPAPLRGFRRQPRANDRPPRHPSRAPLASTSSTPCPRWAFAPPALLSYGPPWALYLGGYQDRLLGGLLGQLDLGCTAPVGVEHKDLGGEVLR